MSKKYDYKNISSDYDDICKKYKWHAPEIVFGLLYDYVQVGTKLLDIGIGTGICSQRFYKEGVEIFGLDNSKELLSICKSKNISENLVFCDLLNDEIPFPNHSFDYIICCGVLLFSPDLSIIFRKVNEKLKKGSIFIFTILENHINDDLFYKEDINKTIIYRHRTKYIDKLMQEMNLIEMTNIEFLTYKNIKTNEKHIVKLLMMKKN
jgi:predicted TPR repeat methyltransferase